MLETELLERVSKALSASRVPPAALLVEYVALLMSWNEKINLTGAKTPEEFVLKHVADVWYALEALGATSEDVWDVGSGCGIPGLVIGIVRPDVRVTLVERRGKKANVLASIISKLSLDERIRVIARPFEEASGRERAGEIWMRGFLPGPKLAQYFSEFFPKGDLAQVVLMKGPAWPNERLEIMSAQKIRANWQERFASSTELHYKLPNDAGERTLAIV